MPEVRWKLTAPAVADVTIGEGFWGRRVRTNRRVTLDHIYRKLQSTGRFAALRLDRPLPGGVRAHPFYDSDVAKWIEAAAYVLAAAPDARLARRVDRAVGLLARAQRPDGYLNSYFSRVDPDARWTNLRDMHELYCAGHLIEAGVAHAAATGRRALLDVAARCADHVWDVFGPGRRRGCPGHEEIELALVRLYRATGRRRYLDLSRRFVDARGRRPHVFDIEAAARGEDPEATARWRPYAYHQAHRPVRRQRDAVGHAVRAMYLYSAMADLAAETHDAGLLAACRRLWASVTQRRMYITGGVGSAAGGERFTADYDLPNATAYAETCAAVGLVFWARRLLAITADGRYADVMERALYNGVLSGVGLDGRSFFYANPLAHYGRFHHDHRGDGHRQAFFGCACCPPNVARLIASVGACMVGASPRAAWVHLYAAGAADLDVGGRRVTLRQRTDYPWDGRVRVEVAPDGPCEFDLMLRVPGWCESHAVAVNGRRAAPPVVRGYARIRRRWGPGDAVELSLAMPVRRVAARPDVPQDAGRVALQRGPLVYCLEQVDHTADVHTILLPDASELTARFRPRLLGGAAVIEGGALALSRAGWRGRLYRPSPRRRTRAVRIRAVPYCLWDNREKGAMAVWLPRA